VSAKSTTRKGTTVTKTYQIENATATAIGIAVPEAVSVSMAGIVDHLREGFVGARGLLTLDALERGPAQMVLDSFESAPVSVRIRVLHA